MKKFIVGAAVAAAYMLTKNKRKQPKISQVHTLATEVKSSEIKQKFNVGDMVITVNPYTVDYVVTDLDLTPLYYDIYDVIYDKERSTYWYALTDETDIDGQWYSEEWLSYPPFPEMTAEVDEDVVNEEVFDVNTEKTFMSEKDRDKLSDKMDEMARSYYVDYLLDVMIHGNVDEKENAERKLTELVSEGEM